MTPEALQKIILEKLVSAGCENAAQESVWFTAEAANLKPGEIPGSEKTLPDEVIQKAFAMAERRGRGEPMQYILGDEYFGDYCFKVGPGCLIPRPETWGMVEFAVAVLPRGGRFCELGTGSGAVALSVAEKRPDAEIHASEISPDALKWALKNRELMNLPRCDFRKGSLFEPFPPDMTFDFVAANLPYIPHSAAAEMQKEVVDFEPGIALSADREGRAVMEEAIAALPARLNPAGYAVFECGSEQIAPLRAFALQYFKRVSEMKDLFGKPRFLLILPQKGV